MTVTDFLLARCQDTLDDAACDFEVDRTGAVRCVCVEPGEGVQTALNQMAFVLWLSELDCVGDTFLRILADEHAHHPDYRPEWHRVQ